MLMRSLVIFQFMIIFYINVSEASTMRFKCANQAKENLNVTISESNIWLSGAIKMLGKQYAMGNPQMAKQWAMFFNVKNNFVNQEVLVDLKMLSGNPGVIRYLVMRYGLQEFIEFSCFPEQK